MHDFTYAWDNFFPQAAESQLSFIYLLGFAHTTGRFASTCVITRHVSACVSGPVENEKTCRKVDN